MSAHDHGAALVASGAPHAAEGVLRSALASDPNSAATRHALGWALLAQGRYQEGWPLYDARHELPGAPPKPALPFAEWAGEPLAGKHLLVFPEQGFGDQIMYSRFALEASRQGADVTLICWPALHRLFAESFPGVRVLATNGPVDFPDPDFWVMSSSLPGRFGATPATLPQAPYLVASPAGAGGIGVMTRGSPKNGVDATRSLPADIAMRLLSLPGAIDLSPEVTGATSFAETASIIQALRRVISVDTSVAHLAGALGKPVDVLLPSRMVDWRWGTSGDRTPWYTTMRLHRQSGSDWASLVEAVIREC